MSKIYFSWVDAEDAGFGPGNYVEDEHVFSIRIEHLEGEVPTATVGIKNPRIGLLNAGRKQWVRIAYDNLTTVTEIFHGRLVGTPSNILGEKVTLQFTGQPLDYATAKQRVAETLKVAPFYDPIFIAENKRDDPDTILEGYSAFWHVDRVSGVVTISDAIEGEDGTGVYTADDVLYSSVEVRIDRPPLARVEVEMDVSWAQEFSDYVNFGTWTFDSYAGDGILSEWPKALQSLDGGWTAASSVAIDTFRVNSAQTITTSYEWQNTAKKHGNGATMSVSTSNSAPALPNGFISRRVTYTLQNGFIDPFAVDGDGDPAPINIPESYQDQSVYIPKWRVRASLVARYDARRERTEKVHFSVTADMQPVFTDDGSMARPETISLSGGDVGQPILDIKNWTSVAGSAVALGQIIFPVGAASGSTAQIATTPGTAGLVPPDFSDIAGTPTSDGTVVWSSLGTTGSISSAPNWKEGSTTPTGTVILPRRPVSIRYDWLVQQGLLDSPPVGTNVNQGLIIEAAGTFQQCTTSGTTDIITPAFSATPGVTTSDGTAVWTSIGTELPLGSVYFIATSGGTSGATLPGFSNALGTTTTDGSVTWTSLGTADVPIGGYPGRTARNAFFPTDRGLQAIEYGIARARAKVRLGARPVQIKWAPTSFERLLALSCRKNASIADPRLPGGGATGKVAGYTIEMSGSGAFRGTVTIACAVGLDGTPTVVSSSGGYVEAGYVSGGYVYGGGTVGSLSDILFTPPSAAPADDDLIFPLDRAAAVKFEQVHGSLAEQAAALNDSLSATASISQINKELSQFLTPTELGYLQQSTNYLLNHKSTDELVRTALAKNPIWLELELVNLTDGPFAREYFVDVTPLSIPKTIDLQAPSA